MHSISGTKSSSFYSSDWNGMLMLRFIGLCYVIARALIFHETNLASNALKIPLNMVNCKLATSCSVKCRLILFGNSSFTVVTFYIDIPLQGIPW